MAGCHQQAGTCVNTLQIGSTVVVCSEKYKVINKTQDSARESTGKCQFVAEYWSSSAGEITVSNCVARPPPANRLGLVKPLVGREKLPWSVSKMKTSVGGGELLQFSIYIVHTTPQRLLVSTPSLYVTRAVIHIVIIIYYIPNLKRRKAVVARSLNGST